MPPSQVPPLQRPIIVAGPAQLGRHTVEEATEAAERLGQLAGADFYGARVVQQQQIQAARDTQMELDAHFVMVSEGRGLGGRVKGLGAGRGCGSVCAGSVNVL